MQARHRPHWMLWIIPLRSTAWIFGESPSAGVLVIPWLSHGSPMVLPWFSHGSPMVLPMFFKRTATAHGAHHVRAPGAVLCDAHLQRGTLSTGSHRFNRWIFLVVERSLRSMDFIYIYIYIFSHIFSSMLMYVIYHPRTELGVKSLKTCDLNLCTTYQWAAL